MVQPPPLLYADSCVNPDQRYFGRVPVPDPFISFRAGRRKVCAVSALEFSGADAGGGRKFLERVEQSSDGGGLRGI